MIRLKTILEEPLLHFFLIGGALFLFYYGMQTGSTSAGPDNKTIIITQGKIDSIEDNFKRVWSRSASKKELEGLVEDYIREEVLYREALALGLDKNDIVIRRRLRQKMEFLSDEILEQYEPTEDELRLFFKENIDLFQEEPKFSFTHAYFNPEKHKETLNQEIAKLLIQLEGVKDHSVAAQLGDTILLESHFELSSYGTVAGLFGKSFADELLKLPTGRWQGPIQSGYGVHLVYLTVKTESNILEFEKIKGVVMNEWSVFHRKEVKEAAFREMTKRYTVIVEK